MIRRQRLRRIYLGRGAKTIWLSICKFQVVSACLISVLQESCDD